MATHSHILAWEIPWTEEPSWLQSMKSHTQTDRHTHRELVIGAIMVSKGDGICLKIFFGLQEC